MGFLIAAVVIVFILCLPLSVSIRAGDDMVLKVGVGIFRFKIFPTKEKNVRLRDFGIARFRSLEAKAERKSQRKADKSKKKAAKQKPSPEPEPEENTVEGESEISGFISKILHTAEIFLKRCGRWLKIDIRQLVLVVASEDAAKTAILYAVAVTGVQNLLALLDGAADLCTSRRTRIEVVPDFTCTESKISVDIAFSFRLWQLIDIAAKTLFAYMNAGEDGAKPEESR